MIRTDEDIIEQASELPLGLGVIPRYKQCIKLAREDTARMIFDKIAEIVESSGEEYEKGGVFIISFNKNEFDALRKKYNL